MLPANSKLLHPRSLSHGKWTPPQKKKPFGQIVFHMQQKRGSGKQYVFACESLAEVGVPYGCCDKSLAN